MIFRSLLIALSAILFATYVHADEYQFQNGEAVTLQSDKAYILVRTFQRPGPRLSGTVKFAPVLIRVLSDEELSRDEALADADPQHWWEKVESNVVEPLADRPYASDSGGNYLLISAKPGTYVLGGIAQTSWALTSTGLLSTSLCMGTVKFEAKAGVVTDLGAIVTAADDEPTDIPELTNVVSGKSLGFGILAEAVAIKVSDPTANLPETLKALPRVPADYRAVGGIPNYLGAPVTRLAPLPGVLDYDKDGRVIDLKAGKQP